jgi:adenine-specific DNA-methyltransferase
LTPPTLDELSAVEFYQHDESWKNRMILGDSLQVMGSLAERESLRGKVQMVYIDPPYGIKFGSNWQVRASKRDVKDGKLDDAARESEQIRAFRDTWELGVHSYLSYLRDRIVVARDLLTESGSIFVQIGDENVHLVRSLLDEVFGRENFVHQITMRTAGGQTADTMAGVADYLVWYARDRSVMKARPLYRNRDARELGNLFNGKDAQGNLCGFAKLTSASASATTLFPIEIGDRVFTPSRGRGWRTNSAGMERLKLAGRLHAAGATPTFVRYPEDFPVTRINNVWSDVMESTFAVERWYVVQTAAKIVSRAILMTTDPGDLVLDPTCGSGTSAYAAESWGRRWITIDTSRVALALARQRLMGAKYPYFVLADSDLGRVKEGLSPSQTSDDLRRGFVLSKVKRVDLKAIANNPDITEGMSTAEVNAAIERHADFELLHDQPIEDKSRTRVSGPFTVESLSPHRSLTLDQSDDLRPQSGIGDTDSFEQSILANLRAAGIQNGRKNERLIFDSIDSHSGAYIQGIGEQKDSGGRVAITIGPQYGTVSPAFIKQAAREAVESGVPMLAVLGFAFDPNLGVQSDDEGFAVVAGVRDLGKVKVLVVRMNVDLLMGDELKKTGSGNLFTVFGEPDLALRKTGDQWIVEVRGVDVYDPTSGDVRSNSTKEIALWMVDNNYDGESFFVRHAYFLGENDPFKSLKTALKADVDPDAWSTLYRAESVPFDTPSTGKIAVKVINDYGDEVMKVLEVGGH